MQHNSEKTPEPLESTHPSQGPSDNDELRILKEQDQAARIAVVIDWDIVGPQDARRRDEVTNMLHSGCVRTANDFYNAALIFQHGGGLADYQLAYALATISIRLSPNSKDARWLSAASWDRIMKSMERPQWYGTQYTGPHASGSKWRLYEVDEDAVSDEQRSALGVPTIAEMQARIRQLNDDA